MHVRLYLIYRPPHAVVIKATNKCDWIFDAVNCLLSWRRVLLGGQQRGVPRQSSFRKQASRAGAPAAFLVSVSSWSECENFIAHYLLGCDEVTDDLWGAKNGVSTATICILGAAALAAPAAPSQGPGGKQGGPAAGGAGVPLVKVPPSGRTLFLI